MPNGHAPNATAPRAAAARALLARAALGLDPSPTDTHVGPLQLRPHQRHAAARLRHTLRHYRTALLADDVGLGKTAVALALLRDHPDAVVVAPAALRTHWDTALRTAALPRPFLTAESLGRPAPGPAPHVVSNAAAAAPPTKPTLLVVDEAHHFRNPRTRRWQALAALAADAHVLLLSATPVHNRPADLAALFALTLGARAATLDAATLARLVVRRTAAHTRARAENDADAPRPAIAPTVWLGLDDAPAILNAVRALPPAVAPSDGTAQPDLDRYTLIRLWTSSDAALRAALRRRRARALTLADALTTQHHPTRAALASLTRGLDADPSTLQLALLLNPSPSYGRPSWPPPRAKPGARAPRPEPAAPPPQPQPAALAAYLAALEYALAATEDATNDARRAAHLRAVRARHPGARVVAFSHSADTVRALYRALAPDGRVAMLTATGGRIASGPIPRADVLARFAPLGQSRPEPPTIERISLLLTTDVLSEGLDLRDAAVVVHLDLPWTPARLAQRTGRLVRPAAPHPVVHVYAFRPPPGAARDLRLATHARVKHQAARLTVGTTAFERATTPLEPAPLAPATRHPRPRTPAAAGLARDRALERWSDLAPPCAPPNARPGSRTAAVRSATPGYLAVLDTPSCLGALRIPTLVASLDGRPPTTHPRTVRRALAHLARARNGTSPPAAAVRQARRQLARWVRRDRARAAVSTPPPVLRPSAAGPRSHPPRSAILARVDRVLHAAPPAERARLVAAAAGVRDALSRPLGAERERAILHAAPPDAADVAWLLAAARAAHSAPDSTPPADARPRAPLRALVLLVP